jgi:hypothetical protein
MTHPAGLVNGPLPPPGGNFNPCCGFQRFKCLSPVAFQRFIWEDLQQFVDAPILRYADTLPVALIRRANICDYITSYRSGCAFSPVRGLHSHDTAAISLIWALTTRSARRQAMNSMTVKKARPSVRTWFFILSIAAGGILSIAAGGVCAIASAGARQTKTIPAGQQGKIKGRIT